MAYGPSMGPVSGAGPMAPAVGPAPAQQGLGIPQDGVLPQVAPDPAALSEIMKMLRGGQVGAEHFLELLSLLASQSVPQMDAGPQQGPSMQGPGDIAGLLGG